jgi:hypothetical protein
VILVEGLFDYVVLRQAGYIQVTPQDVYLQYARAAAQCIHPHSRISS